MTSGNRPIDDRHRERVRNHAAGVWSATSRYAAVLVLLIALSVYFSVTQANFLTRPNIENLLTSVSILFIVSIGMTFVVLTGGIDLSVGSLLALCGIILSELFNSVGLPAWLAVILTVLAGGLLGGAVNGVLIGRFRLSFFVVTLGTLSLYRGIVNIWSDTKTTYITSPLVDFLGFGTFLGIAMPIWLMILAARRHASHAGAGSRSPPAGTRRTRTVGRQRPRPRPRARCSQLHRRARSRLPAGRERERCRRRDDTRDAFQRPREGLCVLDVPRNDSHPSCLEPRARLSRGTRAHESAHTRPSLLQQGADPGPESTGRAGHEDFAHRSRFNIRGSAPRRALHRPNEAGHDRRR